MIENRAARRRQLSDARRKVRGGKVRGEQKPAVPVPIGLASVKLGHWFRVRGAPKAFRIVFIEWSKSDPPVPKEVMIQPEGGTAEDAMAGDARALLKQDIEYVGPPGWTPDA